MNIIKKIFGFKEKTQQPEDSVSKFMPESKPPVDELFMYKFRENGGKFLYCVNQEELQENFKKIISENNWNSKPAYFYSDDIKNQFDHHDLKLSTQSSKCSYFVSNCEYLIASTGAVLISSKQIGDKKLEDLPYHFITIATTSQLLETIGEGLQHMKAKYRNTIPSNITTLKTFERQNADKSDFLSYGSTSKNLYLLLLEDL